MDIKALSIAKNFAKEISLPVIELENVMEMSAAVVDNTFEGTDYKEICLVPLTDNEATTILKARDNNSPVVLKLKIRIIEGDNNNGGASDGSYEDMQTIIMNRTHSLLGFKPSAGQYAGWTQNGLAAIAIYEDIKFAALFCGLFTATEVSAYIKQTSETNTTTVEPDETNA